MKQILIMYVPSKRKFARGLQVQIDHICKLSLTERTSILNPCIILYQFNRALPTEIKMATKWHIMCGSVPLTYRTLTIFTGPNNIRDHFHVEFRTFLKLQVHSALPILDEFRLADGYGLITADSTSEAERNACIRMLRLAPSAPSLTAETIFLNQDFIRFFLKNF